ncbi:MAG: radical SAM protein [Elusimicrobiales bacterium]|nr:radical SAM protein [Elusimicrobiales bacterium]
MKKFNIVSANRRCHSNTIDSSVIINYFKADGWSYSDDLKDTDAIVINTCGSIEKTRKYSLNLIKKLSIKLKKNDRTKVYVFGCLAKILDKDDIKNIEKEFNIKFLKDLEDFKKEFSINSDIPERKFSSSLYNTEIKNDPSLFYLIFSRLFNKFFNNRLIPKRIANKFNLILHKDRLNVLISSGCTGNCKYCQIKKARGYVKSRQISDIISDISTIKKGYILNLVADDCASYGVDINLTLSELLEIIIKEYPEIKIDLRYLNPSNIIKNKEIYLKILSLTNINSLNICVQSGSNAILSLMNRNYFIEDVISFVKELRELNNKIIIRTHVIVGYPGERYYDFFKTLKILKYFDMVNTFMYSPPPSHKIGYINKIEAFIKKLIIDLINIYLILIK